MSQKALLSNRKFITAVLILQFFPLVLFPPESFSPKTQEWWLPVIMAVLVIVAIAQILRKATTTWPWSIIAFSQGFNIISRIMMLMPHASITVDKVQQFNAPYVILSVTAMILSAVLLSYFELPDVRMAFIRE